MHKIYWTGYSFRIRNASISCSSAYQIDSFWIHVAVHIGTTPSISCSSRLLQINLICEQTGASSNKWKHKYNKCPVFFFILQVSRYSCARWNPFIGCYSIGWKKMASYYCTVEEALKSLTHFFTIQLVILCLKLCVDWKKWQATTVLYRRFLSLLGYEIYTVNISTRLTTRQQIWSRRPQLRAASKHENWVAPHQGNEIEIETREW